jgi:hypothetical protein
MLNARFFLLVLIAVYGFGCSGIDLQKDGIPTRGTILSKRMHDRKRNDLYFITVSYFTQPGKENPQPEPKKDSNRTVEEIIDQIGKINLEIGEYYSTEIEVDASVYESLNEGDFVDLFYEKNNPNHVVLKENDSGSISNNN